MLTGQAKKDYQREYMRKRQGVKNPRVGLITSDGSNNNGSNIKSKLAKVGLKVGKDGKLDTTGLTRKPLEIESNTIVSPNLDAGGEVVPDYW